MKVLVIGATGGTGAHAVRKALAAGHEVTAFARNPDAVTERHPKLRVAKGDARDAASLDAAVEGQDAVLIAFGARSFKEHDLQETLMRHLVPALQKHGVKRVVHLSAWGAGDSAQHTKFAFRVIQKTLLRRIWPDKERGEQLLLAAGLDYVNVRPGRLLDTPARGGVRAAMEPGDMKPELTREDTAEFMVAQLTSDTWLRKSPLIGY
jgi:uncharacterized protein YbjT (DUF2867 family)